MCKLVMRSDRAIEVGMGEPLLKAFDISAKSAKVSATWRNNMDHKDDEYQ